MSANTATIIYRVNRKDMEDSGYVDSDINRFVAELPERLRAELGDYFDVEVVESTTHHGAAVNEYGEPREGQPYWQDAMTDANTIAERLLEGIV